ncbi:MAG: DUF2244 domain-containing protein [Caulobacterales bacterium]|jgi:uncharacterized membrane protein
MDATLTPHRSLSQKSFARLIGLFALLNLLISAVFLAKGAFPVVIFLALDVGLLWMAFRMNYRAGRLEERVRVAPGYVHVARRPVKGRSSHWVVNPLWVLVRADDDAVRLRASGGDLAVGAFLSRDERAAFTEALQLALAKAKRGGPA